MLSRKINPLTKKLIDKQYGQLINIDNILKISSFKINNIFKNEELRIRNIYLHNLLAKWIDAQMNHDDIFFRLLKRVIRKTKIDISEEEKHDLFLLEERAFSKHRHIKIIDVNYKLTPKEKVGVKFTDAQLYKKVNHKFRTILKDDVLISNRRIIFPNNNVSYKFSTIEWYSYKEYGFEFKTKEGLLVIRIHDQETLNNTMNNIINKKVKNAIKKHKNN